MTKAKVSNSNGFQTYNSTTPERQIISGSIKARAPYPTMMVEVRKISRPVPFNQLKKFYGCKD